MKKILLSLCVMVALSASAAAPFTSFEMLSGSGVVLSPTTNGLSFTPATSQGVLYTNVQGVLVQSLSNQWYYTGYTNVAGGITNSPGWRTNTTTLFPAICGPAFSWANERGDATALALSANITISDVAANGSVVMTFKPSYDGVNVATAGATAATLTFAPTATGTTYTTVTNLSATWLTGVRAIYCTTIAIGAASNNTAIVKLEKMSLTGFKP